MRLFFYLQNNPLNIKQIQIIIPNFRLFATPNPTFAAGNTKLLFACTGRPCGCPMVIPNYYSLVRAVLVAATNH